MRCIALLVIALAWVVCPVARADDRLQTLAVNGNWMAMAHQENLVAAPDVCVVFNSEGKVAIRSGDSIIEFRVVDESWSLPTNTHGSIEVHIKDWTKTFEVAANDANSVSAPIALDTANDLFTAMDNSSLMTVKVGKEVRKISLIGSTKVTNAFRNCAGLKGTVGASGNNPFQ